MNVVIFQPTEPVKGAIPPLYFHQLCKALLRSKEALTGLF